MLNISIAFSKYFLSCKFFAILSFTSAKLLLEPSSEFVTISVELIFVNKVVLLFKVFVFKLVISFSSLSLLLLL